MRSRTGGRKGSCRLWQIRRVFLAAGHATQALPLAIAALFPLSYTIFVGLSYALLVCWDLDLISISF